MRPALRPSTCLLLLALGASTLSGCWAVSPRLPFVAPPENLPEGAFLAEVPGDTVAGWSREPIRVERDAAIPGLNALDPLLADRVLSHQVVVGMNTQQLVWSLLAHPTRVRDLGPPGGHVLMWEPGRWFVRLSEEGRAVSAGRY